MKLLAIFVVLLIPASVAAADLVRRPGASIWIAPSTYNHRFTSEAGDWSAPPATWHIAQWNIPKDLVGSKTAPPGAAWDISNSYGRVGFIPSTGGYQLAQNGAKLPACGTEYDLFLEPTDSANYPGYPPGIIQSISLNAASSIKLSAGINLVYESVTDRCATPHVNYVAYIASLELNNAVHNQRLFIQIDVRDSRQTLNHYRSWCPGYETDAYPRQFCEDTDVRNFGVPALVPGNGRAFFTIDLYNELRNLIQSGHVKSRASSTNPYDVSLDTDLSHWKVSRLYVGQTLQGSAVATSQWDSIGLVVQ
ncbi:hypothetical protein [Dyella flagellata]|uniref:Uncharacterized protein n=1 Tax=Dyella flagellata TaxID=1867833 RepID=A0ABQ5XCM9_9GAMM|nr:hypothetical protein [Dyella flagellata]GLQ88868.1 hypothetical protein GCM10007898_24390 [Dyella flagellata]